MKKDKLTSKHADDLSSRAEKQLKGKKAKSIQSMDEEEQAKLIHALNERVKELNCLYSLSKLIEKPGITLEEIFEGLVNLIPPAWQYPEISGNIPKKVSWGVPLWIFLTKITGPSWKSNLPRGRKG